MQYAFSVGEIVRAKSSFQGRTCAERYQVVCLLPPTDGELPCYQIRSVRDGVEWVVAQDRIEPGSEATGAAPGDIS